MKPEHNFTLNGKPVVASSYLATNIGTRQNPDITLTSIEVDGVEYLASENDIQGITHTGQGSR